MPREGRTMMECITCKFEVLCYGKKCTATLFRKTLLECRLKRSCCDCVQRCEEARKLEAKKA